MGTPPWPRALTSSYRTRRDGRNALSPGAYLAKAVEAGQQAEKAEEDFARSIWLKVAAGYRDLARIYDPRRPDVGWWN